MPLLHLVVLLAVAFVVWRTTDWSGAEVLIGIMCGLVEVAFVAAREARAAAVAVQNAAKQVQETDLASALGAVAAAEKAMTWSADELCRGARPPIPTAAEPGRDGGAAQIVSAVGQLQVQAVVSLLRVHDESGSVVLLEVLRRLAMREHALVAKALEALSELERLTDDPDLLARIWQIDHLVTRMRRQVESTAVLGGRSLRSGRRPLSVALVLRGAISEVVQYPRVSPVPGSVATELGLPAHVAPDLMHLLAELIENSCECSDPSTKVIVRAQRVSAGLAIEVEDRAIAMAPETRERMNRLLAAPDEVDVSGQVRAGQIGLLTAAEIAQRHGFSVVLQENVTGGTTALVVVPSKLLVQIPPATEAGAHQARPLSATTPPQRSTASQRAGHASAEQGQPQPVGEPPLPRRTRTNGSLRPHSEQRQGPVTAATPGMAAAFLTGSQRGSNSQPPEPPPSEET
ncbi:hypothetical protein EASAB2608_05891 [Streptomyces sp. EAS-AB2608]|nr:hypothetical protein EASAB2608_05891 [Streptomyces sp. EAS-AB2608]